MSVDYINVISAALTTNKTEFTVSLAQYKHGIYKKNNNQAIAESTN